MNTPLTRTPLRPALYSLSLALILGLSACATNPERNAMLQQADSVLLQAQSRSGLQMVVRPDTLTIGQELQLQVSTSRPGYLYIYQIGTEQSLSLVFPNAMDGANYLKAGTYQLPNPSWLMRARGPAGVGYFMAVLTQQPQNLMTLQADVQRGLIQPPQPYAAALSTVREIAPR